MSHPIEERLRDAYQAKTAQLTEVRLDQLTATREHGMDGLATTEHTAELPVIDVDPIAARRRHHWIAPTLAAAAIAAVAIGAVVIATDQPDSRPRPNPPATHISSPPEPSSTPSPTPTPTQSSAAPSHSSAASHPVPPPYLPAGKTGRRGQVPWSIVGSGWQLLQPAGSRSLYLYDPAAGRYLITDVLPAGGLLTGWSPNARQAFITFIPNHRSSQAIYYQVDLKTGSSAREMTKLMAVVFLGYSPDGTDYLVQEDSGQLSPQLSLYATHGTRRTIFPTRIGKFGLDSSQAVFNATGDQIIVGGQTIGLFGLDGHLIRTFVKPAGATSCDPVKMWGSSSVLETCPVGNDFDHSALIVQPLSGEKPTALVSGLGPSGYGYADAWPLGDGSLLIAGGASCSTSNPVYFIRHSDGSESYLPSPPGAANGFIRSVHDDTVTYQVGGQPCRIFGPSAGTLIQYNLRTGKSLTLSAQPAYLAPWQADAG